MGRKKIDLNWDKLDSYLQLKATKRMVSILLEVSEDTIERHIKQKHDCSFTEYQEKCLAPVKLKLIQKALSKAFDGDNTMLIFCLKNICDWSDNVKTSIDQATNTINLNYKLDE
jgi:hypothetical protein